MVLFLSLQNHMVLSSLHQSCLILSLLLQNFVVLSFPSSELRGPLSIYLLQNLVVLSFLYSLHQNRMDIYLSTCFRTSWFSLFTSEPRGPLSLWLPRQGLNPSTHLPLQPHFRLLLQSATPASIPIFFQLYWAAIVSLGRCGPMA